MNIIQLFKYGIVFMLAFGIGACEPVEEDTPEADVQDPALKSKVNPLQNQSVVFYQPGSDIQFGSIRIRTQVSLGTKVGTTPSTCQFDRVLGVSMPMSAQDIMFLNGDEIEDAGMVRVTVLINPESYTDLNNVGVFYRNLELGADNCATAPAGSLFYVAPEFVQVFVSTVDGLTYARFNVESSYFKFAVVEAPSFIPIPDKFTRTLGPNPEIAAPSNPVVVAGVGSNALSWDLVEGASSYQVRWALETGVSLASESIANDEITYTHDSLTATVPYYYTINAIDDEAPGALSVEVTGTPIIGSVPNPTFGIPAATYATAQSLMLFSSVTGAAIRYTIDGSTPSETSGILYSSGIPIQSPVTVKAIAYKTGYFSSDVVSSTYDIDELQAPGSITVVDTTASTQVTWADVAGADSYTVFWSNSSGVTAASTAITSATSPYSHTGLTPGLTYYYRVAAIHNSTTGLLSSEDSATVSSSGSVSNPSFSKNTGTYYGPQSVSIATATSGATIRFTIDGSDPTNSTGTVYSTPVSITSTTTLKAIAYKSGFTDSTVQSKVYTLTNLSAPSGVSADSQALSTDITWSAVSGADSYNIYWDTTTSVTSSSNLISSASSVYTHSSLTGGTTYYYKVAAIKDGFVQTLSSEVSAVAYYGTVSDPSFSVATGTYYGTQSVTLTSSTAGSSIRYTTNGSTPTSSSGTLYSGAISVSATQTVKAIAYKADYFDSSVTSETYTISTLAAPAGFSVSSNVTATQLNWSTVAGADSYTVFWATSSGVTSGSTSITNATPLYNHTSLTGGTTYYYKVAAIKNGFVQDLSSEASGTAFYGTTADPVFDIAGGDYFRNVVSVSISSSTSGSAIRYTTDGSTPTSSSGTVYTVPVSISTDTTLKAIAYKSLYEDSGVTSDDYSFMAWKEKNLDPGYSSLEDIDMVSTTEAYAVGSGGVVMKSTDSGSSWDLLELGSNNYFRGVKFVSATTGFAVGTEAYVYKTTDSGTSWNKISVGCSYLYTPSFVSTSIGWIPCSNGIIKTTDGGATWTSQTVPVSTQYTAVDFIDSNNGWAVGYAGTVIKTTDGGANWTQETSGVAQNLYGVSFADSSNGWAIGFSSTIIQTTDGGESWSTNAATGPFYATVMTSSSTAYMAQGSNVKYTTDSGSTWTTVAVGAGNIYAISYEAPSTFWVSSTSGKTARSSDSGATWTVFSPGNTNNFHALDFVGTTGWASNSGAVFKSTDSGDTWTENSAPTTFYCLDFVTSSIGWGGSGSGVMKTTDGGINWTSQTLPSAGSIESIHFEDVNTGWAVGTTGRIFKTSDGGANWVAQTSGTTVTLLSVHFTDANNGWVVGYSGTILSTSNGGTTWSSQTSGTSNLLFTTFFTDSSTGWAAGVSGTLLKTTNGGATWTDETFNASHTYQSMFFLDSSTGWVGSAGEMVKTVDGGVTWTESTTTFYTIVEGLYFFTSTTGVSVNTNGSITKTTDGG